MEVTYNWRKRRISGGSVGVIGGSEGKEIYQYASRPCSNVNISSHPRSGVQKDDEYRISFSRRRK